MKKRRGWSGGGGGGGGGGKLIRLTSRRPGTPLLSGRGAGYSCQNTDREHNDRLKAPTLMPRPPPPGGGGGYSTQSWVSTVKLIKKAVAVNLHTEGVVTFP